MKNKLFNFVITFAVIITGLMFLTACGPQARITGITCTINSANTHFDGTKFNYTYGEEMNITKSDFEVTAHYSNSTTKTVTDFTLDTSNIAANAEPGTYTISISYLETTPITYSVIIHSADVTGKMFSFLEVKVLHEDGSELSADEIAILEDAGDDTLAMTASINDGNQGNTINYERNGTVSGTCDFGSYPFDELITLGEPYYYTFNANSVNQVEMFAKEGGEIVEGSKFVGNLVCDTLTLTMNIGEVNGLDTPLIWRLTLKLTGELPVTA